MSVEAYTIIIPKPLAKKLEEIARENNLTINDIFAMAIKEFIEREEKRKRRGR